MEIIKIQRYGSHSCGVQPENKGNLLRKEDVEEILKHILDDDDLIRDRVLAFLNELEEEPND